MTTLERPLPLNVVVAALLACCVGGFAMGLVNAMKVDRGGAETSKTPAAEGSGAPNASLLSSSCCEPCTRAVSLFAS